MIDNNNPHTVYFDGYHIDYWKDHRACGIGDEWDHCYIRSWTEYGPIDCMIKDKAMYDKIRPVLNRIFELGQNKAKKDLREFLNIKE